MKILISGGLGYIGSHTAVELLNNNHEIVIIDNLYNSQIETKKHIEKISHKKVEFYNLDATKYEELKKLGEEHAFDGIIHFAGFKAVGESVSKPLDYYENNLISTINLSKLAVNYGIHKFIFSSSATVYGNAKSPLRETMKLLERTNPYGETKAMSERILTDLAKANKDLSITLLRYFNPVGAHHSGLIGEIPNGTPNNLMPYITQVALGVRDKLYVYGDDYDTPDGTGIRDYIHVVDLAKGHVAALNSNNIGINIYNLGTGKGTSVLEMIKTFEEENRVKIPFEVIGRRPGDIGICYADVSKAKYELDWNSELTIEDMVKDSWNFEKKNRL